MDKIYPSNTLRPGTKALTLVEHQLHGLSEFDHSHEFICIIRLFQTVEIDSEPGWIRDDTGSEVTVIAIKVPDTDGTMQSVGIELDLLLVAANDN